MDEPRGIPLHEQLSSMVQHAPPGTLIPVDSIRELLRQEQVRAASVSGLSLEEVAQRCATPGSRNKPVQPSTVRKWIREGLRGVRLTAFRWGKSYRVTEEALREFISAVREAPVHSAPLVIPGARSLEDEVAAARQRFAGGRSRG